MLDTRHIKIFAGTSHEELGKKIAAVLKLPFSKMLIRKFACGEIYAKPEDSVRGCQVFIIQTATSNVNEELIELFIMLDALKRSFAEKIHVIMPHFGYSRQDRVSLPREPISAKLIAKLIGAAGADHLITLNLHSAQEQGFFDFPVDNLGGDKMFARYFQSKKLEHITVVSPDTGGAKKAKCLADYLGAHLAIIHKSRPSHNISTVNHVVGEVRNRTCIIYDDMIDTGGSVINTKKALEKAGAKREIYLAATHPVFSLDAAKKIAAAHFKEVVVTDTIPIAPKNRFKGLKILSVAPLLSKVIKNVYEARSVSRIWA